MLKNRTFSCIAVGLLVLLAGTSAFGQGLAGMQLFAPAEVSSYGKGPQPNEGFFFVFDGLYWTISAPRVVPIGHADITRIAFYPNQDTTLAPIRTEQTNGMDTGRFGTDFTAGNRIELGRVCNNHGWMASVFQMRDLTQSEFKGTPVPMVVADPAFGPSGLHWLDGTVGGTPSQIQPLALTFNSVFIQNRVTTWGIEVDYIGRSNQLHNGGFFEWFIGPRYIEFDDRFLVNANGGILDASSWDTEAQNHIISGQIGARWFKKRGRWMLSTEGRFLAGMNNQNIRQSGFLGSNLTPPGGIGEPLQLGPQRIPANPSAIFIREFTPGAELRVEARYQITRAVSFRAGWTGLWLDHIARASSMIDYTMPDFGILRDMNRQNVFMNGLVIGIDVNR